MPEESLCLEHYKEEGVRFYNVYSNVVGTGLNPGPPGLKNTLPLGHIIQWQFLGPHLSIVTPHMNSFHFDTKT